MRKLVASLTGCSRALGLIVAMAVLAITLAAAPACTGLSLQPATATKLKTGLDWLEQSRVGLIGAFQTRLADLPPDQRDPILAEVSPKLTHLGMAISMFREAVDTMDSQAGAERWDAARNLITDLAITAAKVAAEKLISAVPPPPWFDLMHRRMLWA